MKIYSERLPLKYLISDRGICLGFDTKRFSLLFLVCKQGVAFRVRPPGDRVVEELGYDAPSIYRFLLSK
ncbi:hypothetical protein GCM10007108_08310 [Thermogymnomonas acidicola]|uniref:Uncharacterized protein n=1 Tax=Thermogymnomonas acidicola TaxID=399579 RepID=A0AA37BR48_9ARCH|nr:hypothetical protein [Thermogymnomonas acidicola]GGM72523.1 hypothetical protein GCM10007108_08310 [Thermogymnomonas acidicola]